MTEPAQKKQDWLYKLLPAIYRIRDVNESGQSLRALMAVIESEADRLKQDIDGLYDDWFIETCAEWVIPYIGDLLGVRNLHSGEDSGGVFNQRAYVANTLGYRRRKGTASVLEQLARDVTGWPAHAEEFFQRLITNQHLNHVRRQSLASVDLRAADQLELLGGPFETATHTIDVRRIAGNRGKYNIPNIGIFLWRLQSYFISRRALRKIGNGRYTFSPLGNDITLFNRPQTETEITQLAEEINVPGLLRRRALYDELEALRAMLVSGGGNAPERYFGLQPVIQIFFDKTALKPEEIVICNLSGWEQAGWLPADSREFTKPETEKTEKTTFTTKVAVDPVLGRLAVLGKVKPPEKIRAGYAYGFSADIGGGPYQRNETLKTPTGTNVWHRKVGKDTAGAGYYQTLADAVSGWAAWAAQSEANKEAVITIINSDIYQEQLSITFNTPADLTIQADQGHCPTLCLLIDKQSMGDLVIASGKKSAGAKLTLNGLLIEGGICVEKESGLQQLNIVHCTIVPGRGLTADNKPRQPNVPSISASPDSNDDLKVNIQYSIAGPLNLPDTINGLSVQDSIIHAEQASNGGSARYINVLVSGSLPSLELSKAKPSLKVKIGDEEPRNIEFKKKPDNLSSARDMLDEAIRVSSSSLAYARAKVIMSHKRLVVLPGLPMPVKISNTAVDNKTGAELRFSDASERSVLALLSAHIQDNFKLSSAKPEMNISMAGKGPFTIQLKAGTSTLNSARDQLHAAIRAADGDTAFKDALVDRLDDQLIILPGKPDTAAIFGPTENDPTTYRELGLDCITPAIGTADGKPGPKASLIRSTVFGSTSIRELNASEMLFTGPVLAQRRQAGCTRFSFVPDGSRVPRRYYCQPDLALEEYAKKMGKSSVDQLTDEQRKQVIARNTPAFSSECYGDPEYGQLSVTCAESITAGVQDGSEMGVFCQLKQPQRRANLEATFEEYLRFGLEAGIFNAVLERNQE